MKEIILKTKAAKLVKKGSPLLNQEDLARPLEAKEGECVRVCDEKKEFLAMAYVGFQHKGIGWVYSKKEGETLTPQFIRGIFHYLMEKEMDWVELRLIGMMDLSLFHGIVQESINGKS